MLASSGGQVSKRVIVRSWREFTVVRQGESLAQNWPIVLAMSCFWLELSSRALPCPPIACTAYRRSPTNCHLVLSLTTCLPQPNTGSLLPLNTFALLETLQFSACPFLSKLYCLVLRFMLLFPCGTLFPTLFVLPLALNLSSIVFLNFF